LVEYVMGIAARELILNHTFFTALKSKTKMLYIVVITSDASLPSLA